MTPARRIRPGSPSFVALIAGFMTMTAMTIDINLPAIPATAADLGTDLPTAALTVSLFFVGFALGQLVWGPVSDRYGRRPAMLVGTTIFVLATLGCALSRDIGTLLALRLVEGFGAGAGSVLGRAVIRDLFTGPEMARILSLALAAFVTAPIVAPSIGAVILGLTDSWRAIFLFLAGYGLVLLALAWLLLEESLPRRDPLALRPGRLLGAFAAVFTHPASWPAAAVVVLAFTPLNAYLTSAPAVFMGGYGMDPTTFGLAFAAVAAFSALGNLLNARLASRWPLPLVMRLGLLTGALACLATLPLAWTGQGGPWAVVAGFAVFFTGFGLVVANGTALALQPHGAIAGSAVAALGFGHTVVPAALAAGIAALYDGTAVPLLAATLALLLAALALMGRVARPVTG